ncbi:MAG TPA: 3-hydroxyacyl-CoA dehydrogenase NAD-binding domain-containing protein, partial [Bryobacteraceae bacterium]|nr:3-hydroxyacyl-CoA dehydrogenase NAD-binding domain-containing protein [Bryobacteraceae bacterium]
MGSRIAAHFANAGVPALLLDVVLPGESDRSAAARKGLEAAAKQRPPAFFVPAGMSMVTPGNFEDDLNKLSDCDWIIEAVVENLDVKRDIWARVDQVRSPGTIASTNTSGIPLATLAEGFSSDLRAHFLGTHFFNPPRYLHLLELIPGPDTTPEVLGFVADYCDRQLGKGVVPCKDTPNFIANRLGSMFGSITYRAMQEFDLSVEEVDLLTGPLIGVPRTATFRLVDLIGLDTWTYVMKNLYDLQPQDPWRESVLPPPFFQAMMDRKLLGDKTGAGFYKRVGPAKELHAIDWRTLEYHPAATPSFPQLAALAKVADLPHRLRSLVQADGVVGKFLWRVLSDYVEYAASLVPEISDRIVEIDRAMRWGYGHTFGPFELWDTLGFSTTAQRMIAERRTLPPIAQAIFDSDEVGFYRDTAVEGEPIVEYFDLATRSFRSLELTPGVLVLSDLKKARGVLERNDWASLVDLRDGVLCLELHGPKDTVDTPTIEMVKAAISLLSTDYDALVIAGEGADFANGTNLQSLWTLIEAEHWTELASRLETWHEVLLNLKYAPKPVIAAAYGRTSGIGYDLLQHTCAVQVHAELYLGTNETSYGLIPLG